MLRRQRCIDPDNNSPLVTFKSECGRRAVEKSADCSANHTLMAAGAETWRTNSSPESSTTNTDAAAHLAGAPASPCRSQPHHAYFGATRLKYAALPTQRPGSTIVTVLLLCLMPGVGGLEITEHIIPSHLLLGQSADFVCRYRLQNETLYSVKWYKDNEQFYNFIASPKIAKRMYPVSGIRVDMSHSTSERVRLVDVDFATAGKYGCEVSADAPSFDTAIKVGHVIVIAVPERGPLITGGDDFYRSGDRLQVNCTAYRSKPAALLNWHVNGKQAAYESLIQYPVQVSADGLETRQLGLQQTVQQGHFVDGILRLRCTASLATLYSRHAELTVEQPQEPSQPPAKTLEIKEASGSHGRRGDLRAALLMASLMFSLDWELR